jgi:hypothetical protein
VIIVADETIDETLKYHIAQGEREIYNDHVADNVKHITADERTDWNTHAQTLDDHVADNVKHITAEERTLWNTHDHDNRYYTETEMNALLDSKASKTHTHKAAEITDIGTLTSKIVVTETIGAGSASVGGYSVSQGGAIVPNLVYGTKTKAYFPGLGNVQGKSVTEILDGLVKMSHFHFAITRYDNLCNCTGGFFNRCDYGYKCATIVQCWDCNCNCADCNCQCSDDGFS